VSVRWLANVGGEEPLPAKPPPAVACVARLFSLLFSPDARSLDGSAPAATWPEGLPPAADAAFPWLETEAGVFAWLNTEAAESAAGDAGLALLGPAPEVVRRVHDKAFSLETCQAEDLEAASLRGLVTAFSPEELTDADATLAAVRERVAAWPDWVAARYTLKPRLGGSGRGRVGGVLDRGDPEPIRHALPRLARQGGAVLEPWLEREADLSAQLHIDEDGGVTLLATFDQYVSAAGVYRGHRGRLDHRLRISSGSRYDAALLESASAVARAAHRAGFHGPCGVDAFVFRGERGSELRPVVELNARFTTGTVLAGLLRRARPAIEAHVPAAPGETRGFEFALAPPAKGWPSCAEPERWVIPFEEAGGPLQPGLVITR
jgi:hypothetical protein